VVAPGQAIVRPGAIETVSRCYGETDMVVVRIPTELLLYQARWLAGGREVQPFEPTGTFEVGSAAGRLTTVLLHELEYEDNLLVGSTLAGRELQLALVTAVIEATPNAYQDLLDGRTIEPYAAIVRRAEAYLFDHLAELISKPQIAAAAGVKVRVLERAFERIRHLPPMAVLRQMRLDRVRLLLKYAPAGATVAVLARTCGFGHLGHFTIAYQKRFGELPAETLQRDQRHI